MTRREGGLDPEAIPSGAKPRTSLRGRPLPPGGKGDPDQYARFVETARQLGCDESEENFQRALRKVATAKPVKRPVEG